MLRLNPEQVAALRQPIALRLRHRLADELSWEARRLGLTAEAREAGISIFDRRAQESRFYWDGDAWVYESSTGRCKRHRYDLHGRLDRVESAGDQVEFSYMDSGSLLESITINGERVVFGYDQGGNLSVLRFPDGSTCSYQMEQGRLAEIHRNDALVIRRGVGENLRWTEDPKGHRTEVRVGSGPDGSSVTVSRADGSQLAYDADASGDFQRILLDGEVLVERYQPDGGGLGLRYPDGSWRAFVFSAEDQIQAASTVQHQVTRLFRPTGALASESIDGRESRFEYDERDRLIKQVDGDARRFTRDADGLITAVQAWGQTITFDNDQRGHFQQIHFPNGTTQHFSEPESGQRYVTIKDREGALLRSESASYGSHYRLLDHWFSTSERERSTHYRYDMRGRLIEEVELSNKRERSRRYRLDELGNQLDYDGHEASYDSLNRICRIGEEGFDHDAFDNISAWVGPQSEWRYVFSQGNRLTEVYRGCEIVAQYSYDALGRRCSKQTKRLTSRYFWADSQLVGEERLFADGRREQVQYLWLAELPALLALRIDGKVFHVCNDHRLAPCVVTDEAGRVVWQASYSSYGECQIHTAEIDQPLRLPGQYADDETGLYYNLARYYDPKRGRFLSPDPRREGSGQLNFFTYCDSNPTSYVDPLGELFFIPALIWAGSAIAGGFAASSAADGGLELVSQSLDDKPGVDWGAVGSAAAHTFTDPKAAAVAGGSGLLGGAAASVARLAVGTTKMVAGAMGLGVGGAAAGGGEAAGDLVARAAGGEEISMGQAAGEVLVSAAGGAVLPAVGDNIARKVFGGATEDVAAVAAKCDGAGEAASGAVAEAADGTAKPGSFDEMMERMKNPKKEFDEAIADPRSPSMRAGVDDDLPRTWANVDAGRVGTPTSTADSLTTSLPGVPTNNAYGQLMGEHVDNLASGIRSGRVTSAQQAMGELASGRRAVAEAMGDPNADLFGAPRVDIQAADQTAATPLGRQYKDYAGAAWQRRDNPIVERGVTLSGAQYNAGVPGNHIEMLHTSPDQIPAAMANAERAFEAARTTTEPRRLVAAVADYQYWSANAMPYGRGSASVADGVSHALLQNGGITRGAPLPGVSPDLEAMVMGEREFVTRYPGFFK